MKRITVLLLSVMLAVITYGQSKDDYDRSKEVYAFVRTFPKGISTANAKIDFGDGTKEQYIADDKGGKRTFVTFFEPINMLIQIGWEIEKFAPLATNGSCAWVIKKKVKNESEVKEGMKLIED